jgi:hypothetical protein
LQSSDHAPVTIVLNDESKNEAGDIVLQHFSRGEQVLALDLMFTGSAWKDEYPFLFAQMLDAVGERPLGMQAAQLIRVARWAKGKLGTARISVEATGMRNQIAALVAAALEPDLFSDVSVHHGIPDFAYVLDKPVKFEEAPELFCLDLYRDFDIDRLEALSTAVTIHSSDALALSASAP